MREPQKASKLLYEGGLMNAIWASAPPASLSPHLCALQTTELGFNPGNLSKFLYSDTRDTRGPGSEMEGQVHRLTDLCNGMGGWGEAFTLPWASFKSVQLVGTSAQLTAFQPSSHQHSCVFPHPIYQ